MSAGSLTSSEVWPTQVHPEKGVCTVSNLCGAIEGHVSHLFRGLADWGLYESFAQDAMQNLRPTSFAFWQSSSALVAALKQVLKARHGQSWIMKLGGQDAQALPAGLSCPQPFPVPTEEGQTSPTFWARVPTLS